MARTLKDKRNRYRSASEITRSNRSEPSLSRKFLNFKQSGASYDGDLCRECGGLTDFRGGFLTCSECGRTEGVIEMFEMERFSA